MKNSKDVFSSLCSLFGLEEVDFKHQAVLLKRLRKKYPYEEIIYALEYYKKHGADIRSLGFLNYGDNMVAPSLEYKTKEVIAKQDGTTASRNAERVRQNNQTHHRAESYFDLFEESGKDN